MEKSQFKAGILRLYLKKKKKCWGHGSSGQSSPNFMRDIYADGGGSPG
jgi:hypothetical protein